jgi:branched-subunit amino acid transport protein
MSALWLTLFLIGGLTFLTRLSFILLLEKWTAPQWFRRGLRFVPLAVLPALILPELFIRENVLALTPDLPRLAASIAASLVAWRTKNILLTILVGALVFYLLKLFLA